MLQRATWRQAVEEADGNQDGKLSFTEFQVLQHSSLLRSVPVPQDAVQRAEMRTRAAPAGTGADEQEEFKQTTNGNGQLVE